MLNIKRSGCVTLLLDNTCRLTSNHSARYGSKRQNSCFARRLEFGEKLYEGESSVTPVPSKSGEDSKSQPDDSDNWGISNLEVKKCEF